MPGVCKGNPPSTTPFHLELCFCFRRLLRLPTHLPPPNASSAFRCIFHLPMRLPPLDASSAFQCVFCLQMRLPLRDLSYASRPDSCTRLPRHILSPAVQLVSRFGSSPLLTSRDIPRHHATYCDVPRYLAPPASLPLPTQLSRDIPRHPAAPASVAHVPSLGYPTTSRDPVASSAAPCDPRHHYVFRSVALSVTHLSPEMLDQRRSLCLWCFETLVNGRVH